MSRVELRGIQKAFDGHLAVDVASMDLPDGELVVLLGPSGCGKTTLLRILAGFEVPDAGCITVDGELLTGPGRNVSPEHRGIGMVFQDHALFPHLRVADNIAYGLPRGRRGRADRARRVAELIELVGLEGMERRYPHELSGGQQQRVALARAIAPSPKVLLLDEPFSGLDAETRVRVRDEVRRILAAAGITALLVTHDQAEALSLAQTLLVMRGGKIEQAGAPPVLYREPATPWVAGFLGDIDLLPGLVRDARVTCELGTFAASGAPEGEAVVGFRPEALGVSDPGTGAGQPALLQSAEFFGHDLVLHVTTASGTDVRARLIGPALIADAERWASAPAGTPLELQVLGDPMVFGRESTGPVAPATPSTSRPERG